MIDIHIEQGKWSDGSPFWIIPNGTHIDNGDIIRVIDDESVINMYVAKEIARRDIICQECPFKLFMGSHNCLLANNAEGGPKYRRICDIPGTFTTSLRFTELENLLEEL